MKHLFSSRLPKRGYRIVLVAVLFVAVLAFSTFSFASAAHAASAMPQAPLQRPNVCHSDEPCVTIWATQVNVHNWDSFPEGNCLTVPHRQCRVIGTLAGGGARVRASCQQPGERIYYGRYTSNWWMLLYADNGKQGWASNVFIVGGEHINGVPDCNFD